MKKQEDKKDFVCRVCGHTEYQKVESDNGIMGPAGCSWLLYIFCKNCFAMFRDFEKSPSSKDP